jgi:hypothetical protein
MVSLDPNLVKVVIGNESLEIPGTKNEKDVIERRITRVYIEKSLIKENKNITC